jgi:transcriptional regulator with XRE-family HTH domain
MAREPEKLVEMRRGLGVQLTIFRVAAELSQRQLAHATSCDRTNVTHIEKGRSRGDERFWTIADELCGAEGALLAAFRVVSAAKEAHAVQVREAQLAESRAKAQALRLTLHREVNRLGITTRAGTVDGDRSPGTVEDQAMKRREAVALATKLSVGAGLTAADLTILDAPVATSPIPAQIGAPDVVRVEAMTRSLMAQDKAFGGGSCRDAVLGQLNWAQQLRGADASDEVLRSLDAALARLESLAGWDLSGPVPATLSAALLPALPGISPTGRGTGARSPCVAGSWWAVPGGRAFPGGIAAVSAGCVACPGSHVVRHAVRSGPQGSLRARRSGQRRGDAARVASGRGALRPCPGGAGRVGPMTEALTLRDPGRARAMLAGRITLATNLYRCGETNLANTSTGQVLATISQVSSRHTARDLITLGTEIRQHTTDSTALDLAHRISTDIAA